ncbi:proteasome ATPase [Rothia nasimurium]|uniref:AAA ATPase forming ring-shaped complexes n=1 Tax=Rothia nasimurium TaxID=85336 RepID=A0A4Y9F4J2_9MICC|nr:proteasome ATPase [Rothia nasimurium]MBF0807758.1 proteasome ATPase [Rothia nasimurium]TFU23108.1 proteasome ATPase [Rothia nasimurium]
MSERLTVSSVDYERILRQLNIANDNRRNLNRQLRAAGERNQKLVTALTKTKNEIEHLRMALAQEVAPPLNSALVLGVHGATMTYHNLAEGKTPAEIEEHLDVLLGGRLVRITCSPLLPIVQVKPGMTVLLNEQTQAVVSLGFEGYGDVVTVREVLDHDHLVVDLPNQSKAVARISGALDPDELRVGDTVTYDSRIQMVTSLVPHTDAQELVLEEVPDVTYDNIGGLGDQIDLIRDAVELPFLHPDIYRQYRLTPPKGILLYGPPGNGKTLIAKAVANSLAARAAERSENGKKTGYFLNIKGPELLDKYVGETERQIRDIFSAARDKARAGHPVVVFFDEMESLFRTRGSGRSSDVETTIVPQLLAEIDGVESLDNVIVIGATNREDMIDPAVLRPGRLDVKIRINRPNRSGAAEIFGLYLTEDLPISQDEVARAGSQQQAVASMIETVIEHLFSAEPANRYISVDLENGVSRWLFRGDFLSGAVIRNIVDQAKKLAIKSYLSTGAEGISTEHLLEAVRAEFEDQVEVPQASEIEDVLSTLNIRLRVLNAAPARAVDTGAGV